MDKKDWIKRVSQDGLALEQAPEELRCDADLVSEALGNNGLALQFASRKLRADGGLVRAAVSNDGAAIRFASPALRDAELITDLALSRDPLSLQYLSKDMRGELYTILSAVRRDFEAFKYATKDARADRSIVAEVVDCDGRALRYAEGKLRRDPELIEISARSINRVKRRQWNAANSKRLVSLATKKGFLLCSDIMDGMPDFVLSYHELMFVEDLIKYEVHVDTFLTVPTEGELRSTHNGQEKEAFKAFILNRD